MDSPPEDVVRSYGEYWHRPKHQPKPLSLPEKHPHPSEIQSQRIICRLTKNEAADACGASIRQWRRWESGSTKMPRPIWGWFRIFTSGAQVAGGPEWEGWYFHEGKFYSPENWGRFSAGELRTWPYLHAQLSELRLRVKRLEEALDRAKKPLSRRDVAIAQIDLLGVVTAQLMREFDHDDDPMLRQLSKNLHNVLLEACRAKVPFIRETFHCKTVE